MSLTQQTRTIRLTTALGEDRLGLRTLRMREGLARMFSAEIDAESEVPDIDLEALIGRNLTVAIETRRLGQPRFFNGFVTEAAHTGPRGRRHGVRLQVSPWLWFLTLTQTCRVFQNKTVPDIIRAVLDEHGLGDYRLDLSQQYPELEYCTQYNESDFNFISRLMERDGLYYFFEHENGAHRMVLIDTVSALEAVDGYETIVFNPSGVGDSSAEEFLEDWHPARSVRATRVVFRDYDPARPGAEMDAEASQAREHAAAGFEVYEYPGTYAAKALGEARARVRVESLQTGHARVLARGSLRGIANGARFSLTDHPVERFNGDHYVIEANHIVAAPAYETGDPGEERYDVSFVAAPVAEPFRPPRTAHWPRIAGTQTAMVVGPSGEEIHAGDHLAVKVRFHWDRDGPADETASCWVRTSQPWTGAGWGAMAIPRIGEEVVVAFEEGDPDRPLIVGRVYNGSSRPPYSPTENRTVTTFQTNSSKDASGFNELRFEDEKGKENVFLHAQRDHDLRVGNTMRTAIGNEQHLGIGKSAFTQIGEQRHETVGADAHLVVADTLNHRIGDKFLFSSGGQMHQTAGDSAFLTVAGTYHREARDDDLGKAGGQIVRTAGSNVHIKAGQSVVIEAGTMLTLKVGGNFVVISSANVAINGTQVLINSGGSAGSGSGKAPQSAQEPKEAEDPDEAVTSKAGKVGGPPKARTRSLTRVQLDSHPTAAALLAAHDSGAPFVERGAGTRGGRT